MWREGTGNTFFENKRCTVYQANNWPQSTSVQNTPHTNIFNVQFTRHVSLRRHFPKQKETGFGEIMNNEYDFPFCSGYLLAIYLWLYSPCGPWPLFELLNLYTVGRAPWTGDQAVARPLPTHRTTQAHRHSCFEWDSNSRPQCPSGRRRFMP
jgi:hypothetical protein